MNRYVIVLLLVIQGLMPTCASGSWSEEDLSEVSGEDADELENITGVESDHEGNAHFSGNGWKSRDKNGGNVRTHPRVTRTFSNTRTITSGLGEDEGGSSSRSQWSNDQGSSYAQSESKMDLPKIADAIGVIKRLKKAKSDDELAKKLKSGAKEVMHSIVHSLLNNTRRAITQKVGNLLRNKTALELNDKGFTSALPVTDEGSLEPELIPDLAVSRKKAVPSATVHENPRKRLNSPKVKLQKIKPAQHTTWKDLPAAMGKPLEHNEDSLASEKSAILPTTKKSEILNQSQSVNGRKQSDITGVNNFAQRKQDKALSKNTKFNEAQVGVSHFASTTNVTGERSSEKAKNISVGKTETRKGNETFWGERGSQVTRNNSQSIVKKGDKYQGRLEIHKTDTLRTAGDNQIEGVHTGEVRIEHTAADEPGSSSSLLSSSTKKNIVRERQHPKQFDNIDNRVGIKVYRPEDGITFDRSHERPTNMKVNTKRTGTVGKTKHLVALEINSKEIQSKEHLKQRQNETRESRENYFNFSHKNAPQDISEEKRSSSNLLLTDKNKGNRLEDELVRDSDEDGSSGIGNSAGNLKGIKSPKNQSVPISSTRGPSVQTGDIRVRVTGKAEQSADNRTTNSKKGKENFKAADNRTEEGTHKIKELEVNRTTQNTSKVMHQARDKAYKSHLFSKQQSFATNETTTIIKNASVVRTDAHNQQNDSRTLKHWNNYDLISDNTEETVHDSHQKSARLAKTNLNNNSTKKNDSQSQEYALHTQTEVTDSRGRHLDETKTAENALNEDLLQPVENVEHKRTRQTVRFRNISLEKSGKAVENSERLNSTNTSRGRDQGSINSTALHKQKPNQEMGSSSGQGTGDSLAVAPNVRKHLQEGSSSENEQPKAKKENQDLQRDRDQGVLPNLRNTTQERKYTGTGSDTSTAMGERHAPSKIPTPVSDVVSDNISKYYPNAFISAQRDSGVEVKDVSERISNTPKSKLQSPQNDHKNVSSHVPVETENDEEHANSTVFHKKSSNSAKPQSVSPNGQVNSSAVKSTLKINRTGVHDFRVEQGPTAKTSSPLKTDQANNSIKEERNNSLPSGQRKSGAEIKPTTSPRDDITPSMTKQVEVLTSRTPPTSLLTTSSDDNSYSIKQIIQGPNGTDYLYHEQQYVPLLERKVSKLESEVTVLETAMANMAKRLLAVEQNSGNAISTTLPPVQFERGDRFYESPLDNQQRTTVYEDKDQVSPSDSSTVQREPTERIVIPSSSLSPSAFARSFSQPVHAVRTVSTDLDSMPQIQENTNAASPVEKQSLYKLQEKDFASPLSSQSQPISEAHAVVRPILNIIVPSNREDQLLEGPLCMPRCRNGGNCIEGNTCKCPTFFAGPHCESFSLKYLLNSPKKWQSPYRKPQRFVVAEPWDRQELAGAFNLDSDVQTLRLKDFNDVFEPRKEIITKPQPVEIGSPSTGKREMDGVRRKQWIVEI